MSELLEVRDVGFSYNESAVILKDVSVTLREGEIVCLLGVSGGGKTTLFNIIAGLLRPDKGSVLLKGEDITGQPGRVSYMLQKDMLLPYRTVEDNVALPLIIKGTKKKEARRIVGEYFCRFGIDGRQKKYPAELSGGMRQRAALLRTYLFSAEVALLDEPFSALDAITKADMHRWYLDVMDEAVMLSDRIYLLGGRPGEIIDEIIISEPKPRRADFNLTDEFMVYRRRIIKQIQGNKI